MSRRAGALQLGVRVRISATGFWKSFARSRAADFSYDPFRAAALQYESIIYIYQRVSRIVRVTVISA
jgi:hypothetical protein